MSQGLMDGTINSGNLGRPLEDMSPAIKDWGDTAAIMSQLDMVISVNTGVVHMAGALGIPVWVLLCYAPDWRWMLDRLDTPWYPSARLFRQPQPKDWSSVIKEASEALRELVAAPAPVSQP